MALIASAKRAARASERKRGYNLRRIRAMRRIVKEVVRLVKNKETEAAQERLPMVYKAIDKAAKRGIIKKNTAARKKSRLMALFKKAAS
ncbi:30S ribosomal protein S20 [Candidatus Parcubacteria bacterium]|nr:MAG: 30S ribosomal protein S20 [Candidatus Parcubacteria bacterium]GIW68513.1 MAG: 30S ribosomal protein S20 [Candidatus Parcubacteria bacterium]GIW69236.1 MAG: 30S ribosomal protein S20 [Candidatus Parcubacteria bacterium]